MAYYDKKVIYLSETEYGNRIKGAGFVRMECRGESCSFDMHVSGMRELPDKKYDICVISLHGKEYPIGKIFLHQGAGEWKAFYENGRVTVREDGEDGENDSGNVPVNNMDKPGQSIKYRELAKILVRISDTKTLTGKLPFEKLSYEKSAYEKSSYKKLSYKKLPYDAKNVQAAELAAEVPADETEGKTGERNDVTNEVTKGVTKEGKNVDKKEDKIEDKIREKIVEMSEGRGIWKFVRGGKDPVNDEENADRQMNAAGDAGGENAGREAGKRAGESTETRGEEKKQREVSVSKAYEAGTRNDTEQEGNREKAQECDCRRLDGMKNPERDDRKTERETGWKWGNSSRVRGRGTGEATGGEKREEPRGEERKGEERKGEERKGVERKGEERKREEWIREERKMEEQRVKEQTPHIDDVILNDKWDQLRQIYSVVHPYEDERQYIAIQPKDFVIMTGDYQHLANNSFLLHGFYNYRHIILGREQDGSFYLGVPGVYYEREKMVALMFGFEAFECEGGIAEAGKFGYYLRKVKI